MADLTPHERRALEALDVETAPDEFWASFFMIGQTAELDRTQTKRAVRRLARKGLASYRCGLWTEEGRPAGSGYAITKEGRAIIDAMGGTNGT